MTGPVIGPRMLAALRKLHELGGVAKSTAALADALSEGGRRGRGVDAILRCRSAGLMMVDPTHPAARNPHTSRGALVLTKAGRRALGVKERPKPRAPKVPALSPIEKFMCRPTVVDPRYAAVASHLGTVYSFAAEAAKLYEYAQAITEQARQPREGRT